MSASLPAEVWVKTNMPIEDANDIIPIFAEQKINTFADIQTLTKADLKRFKLLMGVRNRLLEIRKPEQQYNCHIVQKNNLKPKQKDNHIRKKEKLERPKCQKCKQTHNILLKPREEWQCRNCDCMHNIKWGDLKPKQKNIVTKWSCIECRYLNLAVHNMCQQCGTLNPTIYAPRKIENRSVNVTTTATTTIVSKKKMQQKIKRRVKGISEKIECVEGLRVYVPYIREEIAEMIGIKNRCLNLYFLHGMENIVRKVEDLDPNIHFGRAWLLKCDKTVLKEAYVRSKKAIRLFQDIKSMLQFAGEI